MNRRTFLKQTASTAALMAAAPALFSAESSNPKRAMKKAIMWATVNLEGSVSDKFQAIKTAGFDGVEPMSKMDVKEVLRARDATGLEIPSVCCASHWSHPLSDPDPKVRADGLEGARQALREARQYGATSVLLVPAVVNAKVSYADAYTRSQAEIKKLIPLAEELGVKIAIENVWNQFLLSPLEAARYVDEFNSPMVGWHFDVGNIVNYAWPEQWIQILGKRILKIHIKEFSRTKRDKEGLWKGFEVPLLEGDNNWPEVMQALDKIGYRGWAITEQPGGDSQAGLNDLAARLEKILAL